MIEEPPVLTVKRPSRRPSADQIAAFQGVPTGFVIDALYGLGAMGREIQPLLTGPGDVRSAAGPALTADNGPADILATIAAISLIQPGDILVAGFGAHQGCAASGDRTAGMMKNAGAAGFVTDGPMRDFEGIAEVGLPCWCTGLTPGSPFTMGPGRVGLPIQIAGQQVETGDMIIADRDGVAVVPFAEIERVAEQIKKVREREEALDAEVAAGLVTPQAIADLMASDKVAYID